MLVYAGIRMETKAGCNKTYRRIHAGTSGDSLQFSLQ